MKRSIVRILLALIAAAGLGGVRQASAQYAYGSSTISITTAGVYSTSMTDVDVPTQAYYSVQTDAYLWVGSAIGASGSGAADGGTVGLNVPITLNTSYWIQTNHWVVPLAGSSGKTVPNFSCVTAEWYTGSFTVYACGTTTSPASVYVATSEASGNTDGSPPVITGVNQTTYGTAVAGTSGYVILYGSANNLSYPWVATSVSISGGISASITYLSQGQVNVYYSIPSGTSAGSKTITLSTPYGSSTAPFSVYDLSIGTTSIPASSEGTGYAQTLTASRGEPPYTWSVVSGSALPTGLTLSAGGTVSGTPMVAGTNFQFSVRATDTLGETATQSVTMLIAGVIPGSVPNQYLSVGGSTLTIPVPMTLVDNFSSAYLAFSDPYCGSLGITAYFYDGYGFTQISPGTVADTYDCSFNLLVDNIVAAVVAFQVTVLQAPSIYLCPPTATSCNSSTGTNITSTQTSGPQVVVVGQAIVLSATVPLPPGGTVLTQTWDVPGSTVGGYNTTTAPQGPVRTNFGSSSTTFYWFSTGGVASVNYTVGYSAQLSDGVTATVFANFTVEAPTNPAVQTTIGSPSIVFFTQPPPPYYLGLNGIPPGYGITFGAAVTQPANFAGSFVWAQVIDVDLTWVTTAGASTMCSAANALDTTFPYNATMSPADPTKRVDSPAMALAINGLSQESYQMSSYMYLMWQPTFANPASQPTIPVPLGSIQWEWYGDALYNAAAPPTLWVYQKATGYALPNPPVFQQGTAFATWGSVFNAGTSCAAPPGTY